MADSLPGVPVYERALTGRGNFRRFLNDVDGARADLHRAVEAGAGHPAGRFS